MIVLIPLGGSGQQFKEQGYRLPKPLVPLFGKPIVYFLLESLNVKNVDFVVIPYNAELSKYRFEARLRKDFPKIKFIFLKLEQQTEGAAHTVLL